MRICMVTSSYPRYPGDYAGSTLRSMSVAIAGRGHSVDVVAPYDPLGDGPDDDGVRVHRFRYAPTDGLCLAGHGRSLEADVRLRPIVPYLMPGYSVACLLAILRQHRRRHYDVLHAHWGIPSGSIAAVSSYLTGLPLIVTLHGGGDVCLMENSRLLAAAGRLGFRRAFAVTVLSQDMLAAVRALGLRGGMVVPQGVNTQLFCAGSRGRLRQALGIPDSAPVIGSIGRLTQMKGFDHLLRAMPAVLAAAPDAHCVIGGDGDLRESLLRLAAEHGLADRVHLLGHVAWQDTPDLYAMCDVMVVPSVRADNGNKDGLPSVLLEAMASGAPVVASRIAGIPDVIVDGENGYLVAPGDSAGLADRIGLLLADRALARAFGQRGQQTMREQYDWQRPAQRMEELYLQAMRGATQTSEVLHERRAKAD